MTPDWTKRLAGTLRRPEALTLIIILLWALTSLPHLGTTGLIWEEGTNAVIARQILTGTDWLPPVVYGVREIDKPYLLAWLIAGVSLVSGEVTEYAARTPAIIAVLLTALLVQSVTRRYANLNASFFAALAFLFSPMLLQKSRVAEPDTLVTLFSFAALVVWWNGAELNRMTIRRWIGCGCILGVGALLKGPMPLVFFVFGVTAYAALERRWRDMPGLFICLTIPAVVVLAWGIAVYQAGDEHSWRSVHSMWARPWRDYFDRNLLAIAQLLLELMPAVLLAPLAVWRGPASERSPPIVRPLLLYATLSTAIIVVWPGFASRYVMPIAPAVAVLGGIGWDAIKRTKFSRLRWLAGGIVTTAVLLKLAYVTIAMSLYPDRFGKTRLDGQAIERVIRAAPAPVFCTDFATNQLFYVRMPIQCLSREALASFTAPAWLVIPRDQLPQIISLRPDLKIDSVTETTSGASLLAARAEKR